jgi:hypothetical protein
VASEVGSVYPEMNRSINERNLCENERQCKNRMKHLFTPMSTLAGLCNSAAMFRG